ncbi:hypothetical protein EDB83DRAFT_1960332 [Lactarius deliciosus]|nr:hypothetical protein EDB83DRAFT_1960332 [Lactarius deliciosus]
MLGEHVRHITRALTRWHRKSPGYSSQDASSDCALTPRCASFSERTSTSKMTKWDDPILLLRDYFILTKLFHAIGSLYIWETVLTAGFELDVLRGKRPYKWTIWLYLGTRYTLLLMFIMFFIDNDAGHVPCQAFIIANFALSYISWGFASLIIVLRVIAIWGRNAVVSSIALSVWLAGLAFHIRTVTRIEVAYNSLFGACIVLKTQSGLASVVAILSVDAILLVIMLIGLLRHMHGGSTGVWHLLYKQCIIWMILIAIAEIPPVVFFGLDLNDAWNEMFPGVGVTIVSICAARMYRSLSEHGSLTEYSSDPPPRFHAELPLSNYRGGEAHGVQSTLHSTTIGIAALVSDRTVAEPSVFIPAEQIPLESFPGASNIVAPAVPTKINQNTCPTTRCPGTARVDASMRALE